MLREWEEVWREGNMSRKLTSVSEIEEVKDERRKVGDKGEEIGELFTGDAGGTITFEYSSRIVPKSVRDFEKRFGPQCEQQIS